MQRGSEQQQNTLQIQEIHYESPDRCSSKFFFFFLYIQLFTMSNSQEFLKKIKNKIKAMLMYQMYNL